MDPTPKQVEAGHAFYTRRSLAVYDLAILWYFSRLAWRCPASRLVRHYDHHLSNAHLDIGVGTGYFLDRGTFPTASPRLVLLDPNAACLEVASRRVARFHPEIIETDVLQPVDHTGPGFDSVALNYVLHCLPGDLAAKGVVFDNLRPLLNDDAVVFGATLLHDGVPRNWFARTVLDRNNAHGVFSNAHDSLAGLHEVLDDHLTDVVIDVVGCVGVFSGRAA